MKERKFSMTSAELKEKYEKPIDRIKHMSNMQILIRTFLMFAFLATVSIAVYLAVNGVPLFGLPGGKSIVKAEISAPRLTEETVVVTEGEFLEYSRNIVSYLGTDIKNDVPLDPGEPYVTIKYTTKKGELAEVAANEKYVFFNGEVKSLKRDNMFVVIAEGLFFPELTQYTSF